MGAISAEPETPPSQETEAPTQPLSGPQQVDETTVAPEPTEPPSEGEEQVEEEQRPELPEAWQEHPDVAEVIKTKEAEGYRRAQSEKDREILELRAKNNQELKRQVDLAQSSKVVDAVSRAANEAIAAIRRNGIDASEAPQSVLDLMNQNETWAALFDQQIRDAARDDGVGQGTGSMIQRMRDQLPKAVQEDFDKELSLTDLKYQAGDLTRDAAADHMILHAYGLLSGVKEKELEPLVKSRLEQENNATAREAKKPPTAAGGRGKGGGSRRYSSLAEARMLHAAGEIDNTEMRDAKRRFPRE